MNKNAKKNEPKTGAYISKSTLTFQIEKNIKTLNNSDKLGMLRFCSLCNVHVRMGIGVM